MKESRRQFFKKLGGLFGAAGAAALSQGSVAAAPVNVWSSGDDRITYDNATKTYQFIIDGAARMDVTQDSSNGVIGLNGHGTIRSNGDLRIHLDENEASFPSNSAFQIFNGGDFTVFKVNEVGEVDIHQGAITSRIVPLAGGTGSDDILTVGTGLPASRRGRVAVRNQPEVAGGEFHQPKKAGILVLYDEGGRENFLWVDSNGKLRVSRSDPGADDLSGTIVGAQS
jgi:hypothetical protein